MPVRRKIPYSDGIYFITFTCCKWLPLLSITNSFDLVYKWFDTLVAEGHFITGYVIMPNHVHVMIKFNAAKNINSIIGNGKRFLAYEISNRLKIQNESEILNVLRNAVWKSDSKRGKLHNVWERSFDWKECRSIEMLCQKLDYMHDNPCVKRWRLARSPIDYVHSSARFYLTGEHGVYPVTSYMEFI